MDCAAVVDVRECIIESMAVEECEDASDSALAVAEGIGRALLDIGGEMGDWTSAAILVAVVERRSDEAGEVRSFIFDPGFLSDLARVGEHVEAYRL